MHGASSRTIPRIALGLVVVLLVAGGVSVAVLGSGPSTHSAASVAPSHSGAELRSPSVVPRTAGTVVAAFAPSHPASVPAPAAATTTATLTITVGPSSPASLPVPVLNFTLNVTHGNITNTTTHLWVTIYDNTTKAFVTSATFSLNNSVNTSIANGAGGKVTRNETQSPPWSLSSWTTALNQTTLSCTVANCSEKLTYYDQYNVTVGVSQNDVSDGGSLATGSASVVFVYVSHITSASLSVTPINNRYNPLPLEVDFTVGVMQDAAWANFTMTTATTVITVVIEDSLTGYVQSTWNVPVVNGQTSYSIWIDDKNLSCPAMDPTCQSIKDPYYVTVYATVNLTGSVYYSTTSQTSPVVGLLPSGIPAPGALTTPSGFASFAFLTIPVSLTPLSPLSSTIALGNVTFSATYTGQYVYIANLTVFSATNSHLAIFYASLLKTAAGNPVSAVWTPASPGAYPISFALVTIYGLSIYKNSTLTVQTVGGGQVFSNSTVWHNGTGVLGLSAAAGGTTLLLVGLIVGMIVAFLLGRAVTSRAPAQPAQAWSGTTPTTPASNTCSTCGRSFATPEELAAHAKSEHGM